MNIANKHLSSAVKKAASGMLERIEPSDRAITVYGFKNQALQMSSDEIKRAWMRASASVKTRKG